MELYRFACPCIGDAVCKPNGTEPFGKPGYTRHPSAECHFIYYMHTSRRRLYKHLIV